MIDASTITARLNEIFADTFHIDAPAADVDLVEDGILDSFQLVELLFQLEARFGLRIDIEDIDLDDLRTLERISRTIAASAVATEHAPNGAAARVG